MLNVWLETLKIFFFLEGGVTPHFSTFISSKHLKGNRNIELVLIPSYLEEEREVRNRNFRSCSDSKDLYLQIWKSKQLSL